MSRATILIGVAAGVAVIAIAVVGWLTLGGGGHSSAMHDSADHAAMMGDASTGAGMTDAAFVAGMIPHHEGAVEMAQVVLDRSTRPALRAFAEQIIAAQDAEIATMKGWQADGTVAKADAGDMDGMMHGDMSHEDMMGGMSADDLKSADDVDKAFLAAMIPHHEGAVMMAEMVKAGSPNPQVAKLADDIIAAQEREIAQMRQWQQEWYGQ